jgi:phage-related protein
MRAVYYRDPQGEEPVNVFIGSLPPKAQVAIDLQVDRLNMLADTDPPLPFPYSSQVEGELRELRGHYGSRLFRALYRRSEQLFVLLHIFEKRARSVPAAEVALAAKRWDDFRRRMDERPRRPPRAAGHDAPGGTRVSNPGNLEA